MAQVIIVSNRLPVSVKKVNGELQFSPSIGGLATGLSSYVNTANNRWIGWPGITTDELTEADQQAIVHELRRHNCMPVFLTKKQVDEFYSGYSNSILWPLFHNLPVRDKQNRERWWRSYRNVNQAFADVVLNFAKPGSQIWVHDYQLMLLPELLRERRPDANIGFFMHIPFPRRRVYLKLPEAKRLIQGLMGADLIGFHTASYVDAFLNNCDELKVGTPGNKQIVFGSRTIRVTDFPMGIDYEKYANANQLPEVKKAVAQLRRRYKGKKIIASVERLDISKGYVERLKAYRQFLSEHPEMHGDVVFVLVGAPSRGELKAYQQLSERVEKLAAEINQEFGTKNWLPLDYINVALPFEQVSALFQVADVAFVAPLRDGMNLTPKEFIASKHSNGVVILSDTAGAAEELHDALLVSHRRPESLVDALDQALHMQTQEVQQRLKRMQSQIASNTVQQWAGAFMKTLRQPSTPGTKLLTYALNGSRQGLFLDAYRAASKRLILLDYDGTLVQLADNFTRANPPKSLLSLLTKLGADEHNDVVLISGRDKQDLQTWFGDLPINLIAEHGALIKSAGHTSWHITSNTGTRWKKTILPVLEKYAALTPRARVEQKQYSLVWHYRQSPAYYAQKYAVILQRVLKPILKPYRVEVFSGSKILEIKDPHINKGEAIQRWLKRPYDFTLAIGDDLTDEDTFQALPPEAYSIKVGRGRTHAKFRLASPEDVQALLNQLAK